MRKNLLVLSILLGLNIAFSLPVQAANFSVNDAASLIAAINTANSNGEDDVITLTTNIILTAVDNTTDGANGLPSILADSGNSLTIIGNGFTIARDVATPQFRILHVSAGASLGIFYISIQNGNFDGLEVGAGIYNAGNLTVSNSSLASNSALSDGGGVYNAGNLTVNNSIFSANSALSDGGGIYNVGKATVNNSIFSANSADTLGGGIYNAGTAMSISNSAISGNSADSRGGGIYNTGTASLSISNSAISGNSAGFGGGIFNTGTLNLNNSTISGNSANIFGGGILNTGTAMSISNSTISGNSADFDGGGIFNDSAASLSISSSTISGNSADNGGGILNLGTATVSNSIVAGNTATTSGDECELSSGTFNADANNLFGTDNNNGGCTNGASDIVPAAGVLIGDILAPMANNGGPTQTHALLAGSVAIDTGGSCGLSSDQRGAARDANCDIGAYEAVLLTLPTVEFAAATSSFYESEGTVTITLSVTGAVNFAGVATIIVSDALSGTATSGSDYSAFADQTVTIDCSSGTCPASVDVTLTILTDALVELDETLDLQISISNGMVIIGAQASQQTTILDGAPPVVPPVVSPSTAAEPQIAVFDPAISKLGELLPGQTGIVGEELEWIVTVSNVGTVAGTNVTVTDTLIPALQIDSVDAPGGTVTIVGQTVTVVYPTLAVGQTVQFSIFTTVLSGVTVDNTACVNATNQGVEECASAISAVVSELPSTGESPLWRYGLLMGIAILLGLSAAMLLYRKPKTKN